MSDLKMRIKRIEVKMGSAPEKPSSEEYIRQWLEATEEERVDMKPPIVGEPMPVKFSTGEALLFPGGHAIIDDIGGNCNESQEAY